VKQSTQVAGENRDYNNVGFSSSLDRTPLRKTQSTKAATQPANNGKTIKAENQNAVEKGMNFSRNSKMGSEGNRISIIDESARM